MNAPSIRFENDHWIMPGLATAHSHAFQRALRGRTQRRSTEANSFWSWRGLMYQLAENLNPEDVYHIARFAYMELAMSGVTAVGEFHYLHHDQGGTPYNNRTELSDAVIRAAKDVGIRICLIRTAYLRGGHQQEMTLAQQRFSDPSIELVIRDAEYLRKKYASDPMVSVSVAAHSIRAVPIDPLCELAAYSTQNDLPFHMHVCEQRREIEECLAEYGTTPVALLDERGILSPRFVGVHATHLTEKEIDALGQSQSYVCICRTTERDLGDGLPPISDLIQAEALLCVGVDSHTCENAFEEIRAVEFDERSRLEARHTVAEAPALLDAATRLGYSACGLNDHWKKDHVWLNPNDPSIADANKSNATDAILFGATPRAVEKVVIADQAIVQGGVHSDFEIILENYRSTLKRVLNS